MSPSVEPSRAVLGISVPGCAQCPAARGSPRPGPRAWEPLSAADAEGGPRSWRPGQPPTIPGAWPAPPPAADVWHPGSCARRSPAGPAKPATPAKPGKAHQ